jgi:hypothetical protein
MPFQEFGPDSQLIGDIARLTEGQERDQTQTYHVKG